MKIDHHNLNKAQNYIQQQFALHTWWPKAPPAQAKYEFMLQQHDPNALNLWCAQWLDSGQQRLLAQVFRVMDTRD